MKAKSQKEGWADTVVVGAGYVGLTLALHLAYKGVKVLVIDKDSEKVKKLSRGGITIGEVGVAERLKLCRKAGTISFSDQPPAGAASWIIAISYFPGRPELFTAVFASVRGLPGKPPLVVIRGTVPIGFTRSHVLPELEKCLHGKLDRDFYLASCPERTLSGAALEELSALPQLVGGSEASSSRAAALFERAGITSLRLPSIEAGELAKVFANYARLVQFNLTNFLGVLCHQFNISDEEMVKTISAGYGRLNFLKPAGPGVGGFCLPKDSLVLYDGMQELGQSCPVLRDLSKYPRHQYDLNQSIIAYHQQRVKDLTRSCRRILALGIAFKGVPKTDDTRDSVGVKMVRYLLDAGKRVEVFDSVVSEDQIRALGFSPVRRPLKIEGYDALLVLNNDPDYRLVISEDLGGRRDGAIALYDPWQMVTGKDELIFQQAYHLRLLKTPTG